jgi:serine/threonine protein kinase
MEYHLGELKGRGAYANVWEAKEKTTGRLLAVKRFEASCTPDFHVRIRNEAAILHHLRAAVSMLRPLSQTGFLTLSSA